MLKRVAAAAFLCLALCGHTLAGWAIFQDSVPAVGCSSTQISSTPAGTFLPATHNNGSVVTNADSTAGWTATNFSVIEAPLYFPLSCTYTLTVNAFETANPGVANQNAISVFVDGRPIPASGATVADWNVQFATNSSPATGYDFSSPVLAGWHNIVIGVALPQTAALVAATQGVHVDRLIITQTSTVYPTEPAGSVDPFQYPTSALSFMKSAIGSGATYSSGSTAADTSLQAGGGTSSNIGYTSYNTGFYEGQSTDPVGTWTQTNSTYPNMNYNGGSRSRSISRRARRLRLEATTNLPSLTAPMHATPISGRTVAPTRPAVRLLSSAVTAAISTTTILIRPWIKALAVRSATSACRRS